MVEVLLSDDGQLQEVITLFRSTSLGLCKNGPAMPSFGQDRAGMSLFRDVIKQAEELYQAHPWTFLEPGMTFRLRLDYQEDTHPSSADQSPGVIPPTPLYFFFHFVHFTNTFDTSLNTSPKWPTPAVGFRGKLLGVPGVLQLAFAPADVVGPEPAHLVRTESQYFAGQPVVPDFSVWNKFTTSFPSNLQLSWLHSVLSSLLLVLKGDQSKLQRAMEREKAESTPLKALLAREPSFSEILEDKRGSSSGAGIRKHKLVFPSLASFPPDPIAPYECIACHKPLQRKDIKCCAGCKAVIYCSVECQKENWSLCHQWDCAAYKRYMGEREPIMRVNAAQFDFPTAIARGGWHSWMDIFAVRERGMWKRQCGCSDDVRYGKLFPPDMDDTSLWGLPPGYFPPDAPIPPFNVTYHSPTLPPTFLASWTDYYRARNLPVNSPVSVILTFPMSLYYIIGILAFRNQISLAPGSHVKIHYLGVEKEMDMLSSFRELMYLIPGVHFTLDMIGPMIGKFCSYFEPKTNVEIKNPNDDREQVTYEPRVFKDPVGGGSLTFFFHAKMYQDAYKSVSAHRAPDVVVGLNAGIEAYQEWLHVISVVATNKLTAFFTDYCAASCYNSELALKNQNLPLSCATHINPFGSPICQKSSNNFMPAMTNGFVFAVN